MRDGFLLDTNVVSEPRRFAPDYNVLAFLDRDPEDLYLSEATIAEIRVGIRAQSDSGRSAVIDRWLRTVILEAFESTILSVTVDILAEAFEIMHKTRRRGLTLSLPDLLIAATASRYGMVVVSRDTAPYRQATVPVLDPWSGLFYRSDANPLRVDLDDPDLLEKLA